MDEYKKEFRKLEIRYCEKHTNRVYSLACKTCHEVFCSTCVAGLQKCSNGMQILVCTMLIDDWWYV